MISLYPLQRRLRAAFGLVELHGHHVYLPALNSFSLVIDAGAHRGQFSRALLERVRCRIVALEPNPELSWGSDLPKEVTWLELGLGSRTGPMDLQVSSNPQASTIRGDLVRFADILDRRPVEVSSLSDLLSRLGESRVSVLKLDIEGAEIAVLSEAREELLRAIDQVSVEFHSFIGGEQEKSAIAAVSSRLSRMGFIKFHATAPAEHESDVLFINRKALPIPRRTLAYLRFGEPPIGAFRSHLGRWRRAARRLVRGAPSEP